MTTTDVGPRRLRRRSVRGAHLVMVLAGALGLVLTLAALRARDAGVDIVVAARPLDAGVPLRARDVRFESVQVNVRVLAHFVRRDAAASLRGQVLTVGVPAGAPLMRDHIRVGAADGLRAMSIPVPRARAVNGRLARGDRVDVVVARDGIASVVAAGLEVLDVEDDGRGAFASQRGELTITLAVDVVVSQRLAAVLAEGEFVLTRVTGAATAEGAPPVAVDEVRAAS